MFLKRTKYFSLILALILLIPNGYINAEAGSSVVINEFQVGGQTAYDEFIELTILGDQAVETINWRLVYFSTLDSTKQCQLAVINTVISPNSSILIASNQFVNSENIDIYETYSNTTTCSFTDSVLSPTKGLLVLLDENNNIVDEVTYGTAIGVFDLMPTEAPDSGKSKQRKFSTDYGYPIDTDNSYDDFDELDEPTPGQLADLPHPEENEDDIENDNDDGEVEDNLPDETENEEQGTDTENNENTQTDETIAEEPEQKIYLVVYLSELYIDPDSPLLDSNDEWVELYNPNNTDVGLGGYTLYTGANFTYKHIFDIDTILEPHGYMLVTSGDTNIALSNSGGAAKIVDPEGSVFDQTTYNKAKTGYSWAKNIDGTWLWTTQPTPKADNVVIPEVLKKAIKKATTAKKKKTTTKKASTKKATKVKSAKIDNSLSEPALINAPSPIPTWLLAIFGLLAILYACYEYRFEIGNKIYQLKQHRNNRPKNR